MQLRHVRQSALVGRGDDAGAAFGEGSVRKPRFVVYKARDGWRWRLIAANGRIIATGEAHTRERDAWRSVETVREAAALAVLER